MRRDKKWIVIGTLCVIMVGMVLGYSTLNQLLNINGVSQITADWRIEITDVQTKETHGTASNTTEPTFDKLTANMSASFDSPGDYIIYDITVSNLGNVDAVLDSIKMNMPEQNVIEFSVIGINSGDELLSTENKTFQLKIKFSENITSMPENKSFDFSMNLNYLQDGNRSDFSGATEDTKDELSIQSLNFDNTETSIKTIVTASNAVKYYYSLDNDKWVETTENSYTFYHLNVYTDYVIYVKAEDENGNVVFATGNTKTTDDTRPAIVFNVGDNVLGNNGWYKGITLNSEVTDNVKVNKVFSCTTTSDTCNPTKEITEMYSQNLTSNTSAQKVCIKAIDTAGNENVSCSNGYQVDSTEPKVTNLTLTPNDDTVTVQVTGNDNESGVAKYYYSKDSGATFVESTNSNYTFTGLEEGDYLITVYAEDDAGNKSETSTKSTTIKHKSWCEKNGITDLGKCVIASETKNTNIVEAKSSIESKGTPDYSVTSPSVIYGQNQESNTMTITTTTYWQIGTGYTFNPSTGYYTLTGSSLKEPSSIDYSSGTYYTVATTGTSNTVMYKITGVTKSTNANGTITYTATVYKYTTSVSSYDNSGTGMYAASDDEGTSYYYRGAVGGNYVKFVDKYWRIIRVNGDGSVRMIYDGTSAHENGESNSNRQVTTKAFNNNWSDNAYVGYMYGNTDSNVITESTTIYNQTSLAPSYKYYFGDRYIYDKATNTFKLDPAGTLVQATLEEYKNNYNSSNLYTCFSTSSTEECQRLLHVQQYVNSTTMRVKGIEYSSTSYESAHANEVNSTMKSYLDSWYDSNLSSADSKVSKRASFCNDRTPSVNKSGSYQNTGYGITPTIYEYERFYGWSSNTELNKPRLTCELSNDKFTVSSETGNGGLTKPIGLITADEISMAGGKTGSQNRLYYLYSGTYYWTMSPSYFNYWFRACEFYVSSAGELAYSPVHNGYGVRPVVNLDPTNMAFTGTGTMQDPYVVS